MLLCWSHDRWDTARSSPAEPGAAWACNSSHSLRRLLEQTKRADPGTLGFSQNVTHTPSCSWRGGEIMSLGLPNAGPGACRVPQVGGPTEQPAFNAPL